MDMFGGSCHGGTDMSEEQSELFRGLHDKCTLPMWPRRQMLSWPIKRFVKVVYAQIQGQIIFLSF